ncbi:Uncharacterised protein [Vibrio cholerae]|nr:Uncharacterised protein [Vibrio cholerae]
MITVTRPSNTGTEVRFTPEKWYGQGWRLAA